MTEPKGLKELLQEIIDCTDSHNHRSWWRPEVVKPARQAMEQAEEFDLLRARNEYLEAQFQTLGERQQAWQRQASELDAQRDRLECYAGECTGIPASVGICEPVEGFAKEPMFLPSCMRGMANLIKRLEEKQTTPDQPCDCPGCRRARAGEPGYVPCSRFVLGKPPGATAVPEFEGWSEQAGQEPIPARCYPGFVPVSTKVLRTLAEPGLIKRTLGKVSPYVAKQLGFTDEEEKALEALYYAFGESFDYRVPAPAAVPPAKSDDLVLVPRALLGASRHAIKRGGGEETLKQLNRYTTGDLSSPAAVPEGYAILPEELTAENGAKYLLIGEFSETVTHDCTDCQGSGFLHEDEDEEDRCDHCDGQGAVSFDVVIEWSTIKSIWAKAADALALNGEPAK